MFKFPSTSKNSLFSLVEFLKYLCVHHFLAIKASVTLRIYVNVKMCISSCFQNNPNKVYIFGITVKYRIYWDKKIFHLWIFENFMKIILKFSYFLEKIKFLKNFRCNSLNQYLHMFTTVYSKRCCLSLSIFDFVY